MIKSKIIKKIIILNLLLTSSLFSQDYYYEKYAPFDENIKSPEEFLGYPIGEMHTRHDLIVSYMEYLSDISDKAQIFYYGETYEKRKLVILAISSSDKILNLEKIRENHISYLDPKHPLKYYQSFSLEFLLLAFQLFDQVNAIPHQLHMLSHQSQSTS